ncbi:hypothetical protein BABINDRAFT_35068 [Babjeviella inositovora NRRL Y-12698]|uniref:Ribonucleoside-diphosphate reductase n=1 Tax=Babjeviella inositovora NRRL Y-12698 TaxID=984486 RepID=A0A1E3QU96_9ASCO|nr:uncharacterized protein BABINDRAFT_35068 [Babjeviella inositovora NRRL Y-12698]ODQ80572.1 hypothetical protein BABINDRAFT_35068 [Babjeviella inositovora NRRL Y-12698]
MFHKIIQKPTGEEPFQRELLGKSLRTSLFGLNEAYIDIDYIVKRVEDGLPDFIAPHELIELTSEVVASLVTRHPDHSLLAARYTVLRLHSRLGSPSFTDNLLALRDYKSHKTLRAAPLIDAAVYKTAYAHRIRLNAALDLQRDFQLSYFGYKTLERAYLLKCDNVIAELPQYLFMRVALGIHGGDIDRVIETYDLMSEKYFIHASPTLFNAGTPNPYLSSCFLLAMNDDSIDGIYRTLHQSALISKAAGGVGMHVHNIRGLGSYIAGSNGTSSGLVPMLRVFNNTARYVDQGGNKRPGAFAVYLEPWHNDVFEFLDLRKNHGKEEVRARDLFYALWIPDLFMERVEQNGDWSLFSPDEAPGLSDAVGEVFVALYEKYEAQGLANQTVKAQRLWYAILESQSETGGPFMLYKDACNLKSNQQNLGTIKSSNLCCEIVEYSAPDETAVCNLASLALPSYIKSDNDSKWYDFAKLHAVARVVVRNLDKVIDVGAYPTPEAERSNKRHRPIAVGVQGLADCFMDLRLPFDSSEAKMLNRQIFETIYHAAVEESVALAREKGAYDTYAGSPASEGKLQFDLWKINPSKMYDWDVLKRKMAKYGLRNSLLVAPMPTASTSQILGFSECFEPITSNIYSRRVLSGEFQVVNKYLMTDLIDLGLWSDDMKNLIIKHEGSIANIPSIPDDLKQLYKTVWEISQKVIIDLAADRAPFIDQSQSMSLYLKQPTMSKLTSMHFYAWKKGLKTGMYYLRTQAASKAIQYTISVQNADIKFEGKTGLLKRKRYQRYVTSEPGLKKPKGEPNEDPTLLDSPSEEFDCNTPTNRLSEAPLHEEEDQKYDIFDGTPLQCNIADPKNCDSCSG